MSESSDRLPSGMAHGPLPMWESPERPTAFHYSLAMGDYVRFAADFEAAADRLDELAGYSIRMATVVRLGTGYYVPTPERAAALAAAYPPGVDRPAWLRRVQVAFDGSVPVARTDVGAWGDPLALYHAPDELSAVLRARASEYRAEAARVRGLHDARPAAE